jgi:hypothetical protein
MRRAPIALVILAALAFAALPAQAGETVKSKTKVVDAFDEEGDDIGIYAKIKTKNDCLVKRKFILLRGDDKLDAENGFFDMFFVTDEIQVGDTVEVKTKTAHATIDGERVKCKGSTSKPFEVGSLKPG